MPMPRFNFTTHKFKQTNKRTNKKSYGSCCVRIKKETTVTTPKKTQELDTNRCGESGG